MPITTTPKIWMNGELVDWDKAQIHVLTHTLHYGTGVFEGIRCYETSRGPAVFRLREHMARLKDSGKLIYMDIPYSVEDLRELAARGGPVERRDTFRAFVDAGDGEIARRRQGGDGCEHHRGCRNGADVDYLFLQVVVDDAVARGANLRALRANGIALREGDRSFAGRVRATENAADLGAQDVVFVTDRKSTRLNSSH